MKALRILRITFFTLAIFVTLSIFDSDGFGKQRFEIEEFRRALDFVILILLFIGLYGEYTDKRKAIYWVSAIFYSVILTIDTIVWFKSFIPGSWMFYLHLGIMTMPILIFLFQFLKTRSKSGLILIGLGLLFLIAGIISFNYLDNLYAKVETNNVSFYQIMKSRLITNYLIYGSLISFVTGTILVIYKKRSTTKPIFN